MDKATAPAPTASIPSPEQSTQRGTYRRAWAAAERIVDRLADLPRDVEVRADLGSSYSVRLHFGTGPAAARGVLAVAGITDAEATRDDSSAGLGVYVECEANVDGVHLIARALVTPADAEQLLQQTPPAPAAPAAQPVRLGANVLARP